MGNLRRMTFEDHYAYARRLKQVRLMLSPVQEELSQTYGSKSLLGKIAQRLTGSGSVLSALTDQMEKTWHAEGHYHTGHRNPYDDR